MSIRAQFKRYRRVLTGAITGAGLGALALAPALAGDGGNDRSSFDAPKKAVSETQSVAVNIAPSNAPRPQDWDKPAGLTRAHDGQWEYSCDRVVVSYARKTKAGESEKIMTMRGKLKITQGVIFSRESPATFWELSNTANSDARKNRGYVMPNGDLVNFAVYSENAHFTGAGNLLTGFEIGGGDANHTIRGQCTAVNAAAKHSPAPGG